MPIRLLLGLAGLGTSLLLLGCGTEPGDTTGGKPALSDAAHDHSAAGPHGGHLFVLGEEEYHAELTHDESTHTVAVYLLDGTAKQAVSSGSAEITLQVFKDGEFADHILKASGDEGMYALVDEPLCDFLLHAEAVKGRVRVAIADEEYDGIIELVGHDSHAHDTEDTGHDRDEAGHGAEAAAHDHDEAGNNHEGSGHVH